MANSVLCCETCDSNTYNYAISGSGDYVRVGSDTGHNWTDSEAH